MKATEILTLIQGDDWMMNALRAARALRLPDWMIGAGFVRGKVWDSLHGYAERTPLGDIDLIYFDPLDLSEEKEKEFERTLQEKMDEPWSVKNQARMHMVNKEAPYASSSDALAHWVETPTCVAVKLEDDDALTFIAPHGIDDLVNLMVRPSPFFTRDIQIFRDRVQKKQWKQKWPKLTILET